MSNLNELKPVGSITPFTKFCCTIGNLPSSYMASFSYEEQLLWLCDYLQNTVIPAVNTNAEAVAELQELYIQLHDYVEHYFDNLDVQNEINNKLDEMAENGTLQNLFQNYIDNYIQYFNNSINEQNNKIEAITSGSPLVANNIEEMTDTSRVYVNTQDGKWYYYNGSNWVAGGIYQATEIETDKTLSIQNKAADSYSVGNAIDNINTNINYNNMSVSNSLCYEFINNEQLDSVSQNGLTLNKSLNNDGELLLNLSGTPTNFFSHTLPTNIKNFSILAKNLGVKNLILEFNSNFIPNYYTPRLRIELYQNSEQVFKYMYLNEKCIIDLSLYDFINSLTLYSDNSTSPEININMILSLKADLSNFNYFPTNEFIVNLAPKSLEDLSNNNSIILTNGANTFVQKNSDSTFKRYTHKINISEIGLYNFNVISNGSIDIANSDYSIYTSINNRTSILYMEPGTYYLGFDSSNIIDNYLNYQIEITKNNNIIFFDDFENFNANIWKKENRNGYNDTESQIYQSENISFSDSNLIITAQKLNNIWKSGSLISGGGIEINNNILIEARIKFDKLFNGMWPAFWLSGCRYTPLFPNDLWPEHGEIDIIEVYQHNNNNFITSNVWKSNQQQLLKNYNNFQLDNNYHIFAVKITENSIAFYIDGKLYNSIPINDTIVNDYSPYTDDNNSLCLHFNFAIETQYDDNLNIEANMLVDWIKITSVENPKNSIGFDFDINSPISVGNYSNIIANIDKSAQLKQLKFFSLNENIAKIGWDTEQNIPDLSPCKIYGVSSGNVQIMGVDSNNNIIIKNFTVSN